MKSRAAGRYLASAAFAFLVFTLGCWPASAWKPATTAARSFEQVRISFYLSGSPMPPMTVGLKVGDQAGLPDTNRDLSMFVNAPGSYPISLTGGDGCSITRIYAENTGDKINVTGATQPILELQAGSRDYYRVFIDISCGGAGSSPAVTENRELVRPTKPVFDIREPITIDYYNAKGSGWDWVVVVQPSRPASAKGEHGAVTSGHLFKLDNADNSLKERKGMTSFPALPEGEYEARYVSWIVDGKAGENQPIARVSFRVGKAGGTETTGSTGSTGGADPPPPRAGDLTGLWRNPGGKAVYRVRQIGTKVVWLVDAVSLGSYANVFRGQRSGNTIDGTWDDLPGSPTIGGGRMQLRVESDCRITRVSSVNQHGADVWVRIGSPCDRVQ